MKSILIYLKPYRLHVVFAYIFTTVEFLSDLFLPLLLGKLINTGVVPKDIHEIYFWGSIMIGVAFIAFLAGILNSYFASYAVTGFSFTIRKKLFDHIQHFSYEYMHRFTSSSLVTRFTNDVRQLQQFIFMALRILFKAPLTIIGSVIVSLMIDFKIASIFLLTIPLAFIILSIIIHLSRKLFESVQLNVDEVNRMMQENLSGMRLIKAFFRSDYENKRFKQANDALRYTTRTAFRIVETTTPALLLCMNGGMIILLWFSQQQTALGHSSVGDVVAIINYALRISQMVSMFSMFTTNYSRAKASALRINEILQTHTIQPLQEHTKSTQPIRGSIEFNHVHFRYHETKKEVLHNIHFKINQGQTLAIMGATGSGKSTLVKLIPHLYQITKGVIKIDATPIHEIDDMHLREQIGFVAQDPFLFSGTIRENLQFGKPNATDEELIEATKNAQIYEAIMQMPDGFDTIIGQRGMTLSGGQKQRISIARALIRKPKILIFDDSTSALDLQTEQHLFKALEAYQATICIITQKIITAKTADTILLLDYGEMIGFGTHDTLLNENAQYKQIYDSQMRTGGVSR